MRSRTAPNAKTVDNDSSVADAESGTTAAAAAAVASSQPMATARQGGSLRDIKLLLLAGMVALGCVALELHCDGRLREALSTVPGAPPCFDAACECACVHVRVCVPGNWS